jgi:ribonucleoside-diphosphate reductase alpha chain
LHGYLTVGEYADGKPGEVFISVAKMGSTLARLMESFGRSVSYGLQYGVPLKVYVRGMTHSSFAPSGITDDPDIRTATSLIDYTFRRLAKSYLSFDDQLELGLANFEDMPSEQTSLVTDEGMQAPAAVEAKTDVSVTLQSSRQEPQVEAPRQTAAEMHQTTDKSVADPHAPMCYSCGNQTQRSGSCYVCTSCGSTTGCS